MIKLILVSLVFINVNAFCQKNINENISIKCIDSFLGERCVITFLNQKNLYKNTNTVIVLEKPDDINLIKELFIKAIDLEKHESLMNDYIMIYRISVKRYKIYYRSGYTYTSKCSLIKLLLDMENINYEN